MPPLSRSEFWNALRFRADGIAHRDTEVSLRRNAFLLVLLAALIAILGDWSGSPDLAGLWKLPLALLLLGLAYEHWQVRRERWQVVIDCPARLLLGRASTVNFILSRSSRRSDVIEFIPDAPECFDIDSKTVRVEIAPRARGEHQVEILPRRLGHYPWPAIRTRVRGVLALAWWPRKLQADTQARVVPDVLSSASTPHQQNGAGLSARNRFGGGAEIIQLRDYQPGDPLRIIDWKASARAGHWISRDFSEDQHLEIVLAVDAGRASALRAGSLDRLGHYVNVAARFAEHAIARDDQVGLVVFADRVLAALPPARGAAAVMRMRTLLESVKPENAESNPLAAASRVNTLVRHRSLVVMLTDLDDATLASQLAGAARLLSLRHLPLIAGLSSHAATTLATATAYGQRDVYQSLAAREYNQRLERNVMILNSLGAPALVAFPEQLEAAVLSAYQGFRQRHRV